MELCYRTDNVYDLTGLNDNTEYEWQITADCGADGTSTVVSGANFTTEPSCYAPTDLSVSNITDTSGKIKLDR